jgi:PncC family amidohydrolase
MATASADEVFALLKARGETVGFAESCTGGLVSATLAGIAGVSAVFMGSVVTYSNQMKEAFLGVAAETLRAHGAVSSQVAVEMASGARSRLGVDWAVSVTGIAGPSGGTPEKPVGLVWFAIAGPGVEWVGRQMLNGNRTEIQKQACEYALEQLAAQLKK